MRVRSILLLLLALALVVWIAAPTAPPAPGADAHAALDRCHDTARDRLKAPATAKFPSLGKITTMQRTTKDFTGRLYGKPFTTRAGSLIIESYVDAQNSFGALIRTRFSCIMTPAGSVQAFEFTK